MKMKKHLREHFSILIDGKAVVGPAEVEVTEKEFKDNEHKFEPELDQKDKKKTAKKAE